MYVCMYVCMYIRMYVCMYVCMYIRMYTYVCMYVCIVLTRELEVLSYFEVGRKTFPPFKMEAAKSLTLS